MGCSESSPEPEKYKKKLRSFLVTKVKSLDPAKASDRSSSLIVNQIFEGLYHFKYRTRPYVIEPNLAEGLPKISSDRKIYTIRLKKGIHFQDSTYFPEGKGPEITAQDWIDSWKRLGDPKIQSPGTWIFASRIKGFADWQKKVTSDPSQLSQPIFGFKALDRYTLQIELNQPFSPFLSLLTTPFSMVVPNLIINKIGNQKFSENPIGTGPFLLKLWRRGSEIVLHKNPNYRKIYLPGKEAIVNKEKYRLPLLDEVSFRIFLEDQPLWLSFLKSELHISAVPVGLLKKKNNQYQAPEDLSKNDFSLQAEPKEDLSYIGFNMNHPILGTNINLRKAMAHAYNSAAALKVLYNSRGTQAFGPVPPQLMNQGYSYSTRYPYDLAKAKAFIEKAGHPLGKDLPIFNFEIPGQSQNLRKVAEFFKIQMAAIGVQIRLQPNSWPQFEKKVKNRKADIFAMGWYADYPEAENFLQLFYSPNQSPGPNMTNYKNLKYDQLYRTNDFHDS